MTSVSLFFAAFVYQLRREPERARQYAEELVALAVKEGLAQWIAFGKIIYGWSLAKAGELDKGLAELREGLAACEASNTAISRPHFLSMLAEALVEAGRLSEAFAALDEALKVSKEASDRYYESELFGFKGELLLSDARARARGKKQIASEALAEAEGCFNHAIEIAQSQQSKWFELRAALSLCRLRQGQREQPTFVICCCRFITGSLKVSTRRTLGPQMRFSKQPKWSFDFQCPRPR